MKAIQKNGEVILSKREYDIAAATDIKEGQVVKIAAGLVVSAVAGETGAILGIAAENHTGVADALNPRNNGTKILVMDDPMAILACDAPVFEATGGSATTVTTDELGAYSADDFNNGFLVLVEKVANSTNTDAIGTVKQITDYAYASSGTVSTFTVASAGTANDGDKYMLFPPVGLAKGQLDTAIQKWVATAVTCTSLKVLGRDIEAGEVFFKTASHF